MSDLSRAVEQIAEIHGHLAKGEVYRGWRSAPVAAAAYQAAFNRRCIGRTLDVLFERPGRYPGQLVGRSPYSQRVQAMAPASLSGEIRAVTMTEVSANSLFGALAAAPAEQPQLAAAGA